MEDDRFSFAVVLPATRNSKQAQGDVVIGFVGITQPPQLFYIFDETHWGSGYATEALRAFLDAYWRNLPTGLKSVNEDHRDYLEAHVHHGNGGSERVAAKCGFVHVADGVTESHGRQVDEKIFRLQRPSGP